jgi:hypothetical protein
MNGIGIKELGELRSMIKESKKKALTQKSEDLSQKPPVLDTAQNSQNIQESRHGDKEELTTILEKQKELLFEFRKVERGRPKKEDDQKSKKSTIYLKPNARHFLKRFKPERQISKKIDYIIEDYQRLSEWQSRVLSRFEKYSKKIEVILNKMDVVDTFDKRATDTFTSAIFEVSKEIRTYMNICSVNLIDIEKYLAPKVLENLKFALSYTRGDR